MARAGGEGRGVVELTVAQLMFTRTFVPSEASLAAFCTVQQSLVGLDAAPADCSTPRRDGAGGRAGGGARGAYTGTPLGLGAPRSRRVDAGAGRGM